MQSLFKILFVVGNPGKISKGKNKTKLYILRTEGRRKFKFDNVSFQTRQNLLKENRAKIFHLNALLNVLVCEIRPTEA